MMRERCGIIWGMCMRLITCFLWFLFVVLQYPLWMGSHSVRQLIANYALIRSQEKKNYDLRVRNKAVEERVIYLQTHPLKSVELHARMDLGMVGVHETFYMIVP